MQNKGNKGNNVLEANDIQETLDAEKGAPATGMMSLLLRMLKSETQSIDGRNGSRWACLVLKDSRYPTDKSDTVVDIVRVFWSRRLGNKVVRARKSMQIPREIGTVSSAYLIIDFCVFTVDIQK
jgi:hypothetical protein